MANLSLALLIKMLLIKKKRVATTKTPKSLRLKENITFFLVHLLSVRDILLVIISFLNRVPTLRGLKSFEDILRGLKKCINFEIHFSCSSMTK